MQSFYLCLLQHFQQIQSQCPGDNSSRPKCYLHHSHSAQSYLRHHAVFGWSIWRVFWRHGHVHNRATDTHVWQTGKPMRIVIIYIYHNKLTRGGSLHSFIIPFRSSLALYQATECFKTRGLIGEVPKFKNWCVCGSFVHKVLCVSSKVPAIFAIDLCQCTIKQLLNQSLKIYYFAKRAFMKQFALFSTRNSCLNQA